MGGFDDVDDLGLDEGSEISEEDIVLLVDDEGGEYRYVMLAELEVGGQIYAVLAPEDQLIARQEEVDLSFFQMVTINDGTQSLLPVEDPETFEAVRQACAEFLGLSETEDSLPE